MWVSVPDNVDLSVIVWNLRGNTQLWTKQLAQQASSVAKLSTVQNVALAKKKQKKQQRGGRRPSRGKLKQRVQMSRPNSLYTEP